MARCLAAESLYAEYWFSRTWLGELSYNVTHNVKSVDTLINCQRYYYNGIALLD